MGRNRTSALLVPVLCMFGIGCSAETAGADSGSESLIRDAIETELSTLATQSGNFSLESFETSKVVRETDVEIDGLGKATVTGKQLLVTLKAEADSDVSCGAIQSVYLAQLVCNGNRLSGGLKLSEGETIELNALLVGLEIEGEYLSKIIKETDKDWEAAVRQMQNDAPLYMNW